MRPIEALRPYQKEDADFIVEAPGAVLWSDVGLGKTATALTAIAELLDRCELTGVLVVAPLAVVKTVWRQEAKEWEHTSHLRFSLVCGSPAVRKRALSASADVYLINYENLPWLVTLANDMLEEGMSLPFSMIVYDESTKMKNSQSKRVKATVKSLLPHMHRRLALTGTPAPNGLMDLFGQFLCVDGGARFGTAVTWFKQCYFIADYMGYNWSLRRGAGEEIQEKIRNITRQRKKEDYIDMPPVIFNTRRIELTPAIKKKYDELEKEFFVELDEGEIEAFNAAALASKCLQASNGACYLPNEDGGPKEWIPVHDLKINALVDIVEEAAGSPVLISYLFKHDLERIKKAIPHAVSIKDGPVEEIVEQWNAGDIPVLLGHPASMGHGLNLQHGGHQLIMFGLTWDLELYQQVIGRLDRPGQDKPVIVTRLIVRDTIEEAVAEALSAKAGTQDELREAVKEYRRTKC